MEARNEEEETDDTYKCSQGTVKGRVTHARRRGRREGGRQHRNVTGPDQSLSRLFILVDVMSRMSLKLQTLNTFQELLTRSDLSVTSATLASIHP